MLVTMSTDEPLIPSSTNFDDVDKDKSGTISKKEFEKAKEASSTDSDNVHTTPFPEIDGISKSTKIVEETTKDKNGKDVKTQKSEERTDEEVWEIIFDDLNEILAGSDYDNYHIDAAYKIGEDDWKQKDVRKKFDNAHEYQGLQEILNFMFGPSRERESISYDYNLGSGDHGVDSYILQEDPDFKYFGLTIIQSKLHAPTSGGFPAEERDTMDRMVRDISKIANNEHVGSNPKYVELRDRYRSLGARFADAVPIRAVIVTSKPQAEGSDYANTGENHSIHTLRYSQLATLINGIKSVSTTVEAWDIPNSTELISVEANPNVNLAIIPAGVVFDFLHSGDGKRNEDHLHFNVRLSLMESHTTSKESC